MYTGFHLPLVGAMSFFITDKYLRKRWYIYPQSVVRRTAQLVKIVRNTQIEKYLLS